MSRAITDLHNALSHAMYEGFPEYEYEDRDWEHYRTTKQDRRIIKTAKHSEYHISLYAMFPQTWSSTAMGLGGYGGAAITTANTIVLESLQGAGACVYFGGRFAYRIQRPNKKFYSDVSSRDMTDVSNAKLLYESTPDETEVKRRA